MLKSLLVTNLFGKKDNDRVLNFREDTTIIVGKNGSGKTTLLDILNILLTKSFSKLFKFEFKEIALESDEGHILVTRKDDLLQIRRLDIENVIKNFGLNISDDSIKKIRKVLTEYKNPELYTKFEDLNIEKDFEQLISKLYIEISKDDNSQKIYKISKSFDFQIPSMYLPTYRRIETDLSDLLMKNLDVNMPMSFVKRVYHEREFYDSKSDFTGTIIGLSNKDINEVISKKWSEVTQIEKAKLNSLIKDFFFSLLEPPKKGKRVLATFQNFNPENTKNDLVEVFKKTGLISLSDKKMIERIKQYVKNISQAETLLAKPNEDVDLESFEFAFKLNILHEKVDQLVQMYHEANTEIDKIKAPFNTLTNTLQSFLGKNVEIIDGELRFDKILQFEDLSAGEKQLVSLFVYTRLALETGSVVLIDEPELSLHISWQRKFMSALTSEGRTTQFIVSTHSPFIISSYRENLEVLGDIGDDEEN